jgi:hypothetical protein
VVERVLDQVGEELRQQLAVARQGQSVFDRCVELVLGVLGDRRVGLADAANQLREIDGAEGALLRARLDLGDAQQGGEDLEQRIGLGDRGLGRGLVFARGRRALARILEPLAQAAERRAQVVRDVAGHLAQAVHELLDAVEHGVEAEHELVDLVVVAAHRDAGARVALHDGAAGAADRVDAAHEVAAQQHAAADRQQQRQRAGPGEGAHDGVLHVDQAAGILRHQDERAVGQGEAEAGQLAARVLGSPASRRARSRRRPRPAACRAGCRPRPAASAPAQIVDRPARAEVHAPRHLLGEAEQAGVAMDLRELQRLGAQHRLHVALQRRRGDHEHRGEQTPAETTNSAGIDQRQPEASPSAGS